MKNYALKYVKENYNDDDFLVTAITMLDFEKRVSSVTNLQFN